MGTRNNYGDLLVNFQTQQGKKLSKRCFVSMLLTFFYTTATGFKDFFETTEE